MTNQLLISRHMVVCRAIQENGGHTNGVSIYIDRNKKVTISRIRSSMMSSPNGTKFTVELASMQRRPHSKFE